MTERTKDPSTSTNFIREIVERDVSSGKYDGRVVTRFPPEPNGYLHIGHAKSICLNFGLANDFDGTCHLRFDDTNPETEDPEYVDSIMNDVRWLGFDWGKNLFFASDYFEQLCDCAVTLIRSGKAYVDSQTDEQIRGTRGTVTEAGSNSPFRGRSISENLNLFSRMRAGDFEDGTHVLRAKIDMASPNMKMRDPLLYRIRHAHHYRTGDDWCIYPMYDFAHPLSDAIEDITHSVCTLEFENNRELYDWVVDNAWTTPRPYQYEFNRLNLDYTIMSKRKLMQLVDDGLVDGWDDPRLPTLAGLRRRGVTAESIRGFCGRVGVARTDSRVDIALLEYSIRNDLNFRARRVMAVLDPLRVVITNYPEGETEWLDASYWPHDVPKEGSRKIPFGRELYIERDDFMENPTKKFFRLAPGREARLRYGYFIRCDEVVKDAESGDVVELRCTFDPLTRGGDAPDGRKVRATLHWVEASHSVTAEVRLYDRLFSSANPDETEDWKASLNPDSVVIRAARIEPSLLEDEADTRYQFERQGYFWRDPVDSSQEHLVINRIVSLRDTWAKISTAKAAEPREDGEPKKAEAETPAGASIDGGAERRQPALSAAGREIAEGYRSEFGLDEEDANLIAADLRVSEFFDAAVREHPNAKAVANWVIQELLRELKSRRLVDLAFGPADLARLVSLVDDGTISGRIAKDVFREMTESGRGPADIVSSGGLAQMTDADTLDPIVDGIVARFPEKAKEYAGGKHGLIGFFVGQVMRETGGRANPELARSLLMERLG